MSERATAQPDEKKMRLRYTGTCRQCGQTLTAATMAVAA
jgi:hypothetical protein